MTTEPNNDQKRPSRAGRVIVVILAIFGALALLLVVLFGVYLIDTGGKSSGGRPVPSYAVPAAPPTTTTADSSGAVVAGRYIDFGNSYNLPSGAWTVSVSAPRSYTRGQYAAGGESAERYVRVDITVTNQTQRYVNVGQEWQPTLGVDGSRAEEVFDSGAGVDGYPPSKTAAPGRSVTWGAVWALADAPATIQLGLDPRSDPSGLSHVLYQGRV